MISFNAREVENKVLVLEVVGELDENTSEDFLDCIEEQIENGHNRVVVDCTNLRYFSSYGIGALIRVHSRMKKRDGDVKLAALQGAAAQALRLTALDKVLAVYTTVEDALEAFGSPKA